ncbi:hypothetical protein [Sulfurovum sp. NBC37-1]|nr:hypothetical protein [Sulfurovum sp. NBC37-1]
MLQKGQHVGADLFDLFVVHSGIYLEYAKAYLEEEQIDVVDEESLPG